MRAGMRLEYLQERVADAAAAPRRRDVQRHSPGTVGGSRGATIAGRADRDEVAGHRYDEKGQKERLRSPLLAMTFGSGREPLTRGREAVPELDDVFEIAVVRNAHEQSSGKPRRKGCQLGRHRSRSLPAPRSKDDRGVLRCGCRAPNLSLSTAVKTM